MDADPAGRGDRTATLDSAVVTAVPSSLDTLIVVADFPGVSPDLLFAYWTQDELLCRWWPSQAELDPRVGGSYHLAWPAHGWHLRGEYTTVEPGRRLGFTWQWDHEPAVAPARVEITLERLADGDARLTLTHGPYADTEPDRERRAGHLEGWQHFLGLLRDLTSAHGAHGPADGRRATKTS